METEHKDGPPEGPETTKEQKITSTNKVLFFLWFIIDWRILVGIGILIYSIFGGNEGQITSDAWTGAPNAHYYPPLSMESRWAGAGIAAAFILAGIVKRVNKSKASSAQ